MFLQRNAFLNLSIVFNPIYIASKCWASNKKFTRECFYVLNYDSSKSTKRKNKVKLTSKRTSCVNRDRITKGVTIRLKSYSKTYYLLPL